MIVCASILLWALLTTAAHAHNAIARAHHDCVLLRSTIYCYGGALRKSSENSPSEVLHTDIFISLDVSGNKTAIELQNKWELVDGGSVGPNFYFAMAALPEMNAIFIDGGRGSRVGIDFEAGRQVVGSITEHPASLYNANGGGSWPSVDSTSRERVEAHVALTGRNNIVYIYGGRSSQEYTGSTNNVMTFPDHLTTFNYLGTPQWNQPAGVLQGLTSQRRIHHKGAFGLDQETIYYIGGIYEAIQYENGRVAYSGVKMDDILSYDTSNGEWHNVTANGIAPGYRMDHTVTLDPNTGVFIIYGGTRMDTSTPLGDYLYTLDTSSWEYKRIAPVSSTKSPGAGPRFGHAAVLVANSRLFIIFGSNGTTQSDFHVLDIRNNFTWEPSVSPNELPVDDSTDKSSGASSPADTNSGIRGGDIAGAVVGSIAGILLIGAVVFIYMRKRGARTSPRDDEDNDSFKPESPRESDEAPPPYNLHQSDTRINLLDTSASPESADVNRPLILRVESTY